MNKLRLVSVLFLSIFLFLGCHKWGEPEFKQSEWDDTGTVASQFWTINSRFVLEKHTLNNPPDSLTSYKDTYKRYIRAVVVSSDEGGNFYKSMVIQDETGGVELELDMSGLYNFYPVGQKIVLVCNGLVIGDYHNLPQIGWIYNDDQVGRINSLFIDQYIIKDGLPNPKNLPPILTNTASEVSLRVDFSSHRDINKLVRLENVTFEREAIGQPLAYNDFTTGWKITVPLKTGSQDVLVRTSNYAKFRSMIIEDVPYNLTGILTIYNNTYQFMIRTKEDIERVPVVKFDFTENPLNADWSLHPSSGKTPWMHRPSAKSIFHPSNKFGDYHTAMDDWFISPVIEYSDLENGYLHFEHQLEVTNSIKDAYQIYYTTSNATTFNLSDWKPLGTLSSFPETSDWSNRFPLKIIGSNSFRIAFRYNAPNPEIETSDWFIQKVEIRNI